MSTTSPEAILVAMVVMGVDACRRGWVGVVLDGQGPPELRFARRIDELVDKVERPAVIAIDIPIGQPDVGVREADRLARIVVGPRWKSVFLTPPRAIIDAPTYQEANCLSRKFTGGGLSRQAYGLRAKILEVDAWMREAGAAVFEVHPEVSFATLAGRPLARAKTTWAGAVERRRLLHDAGVVLDDDLGDAGHFAAVDDVLDASVAAWSARRLWEGTALSWPSGESGVGLAELKIWA